MSQLTRARVADELAAYYSSEYERISGKPAKVWGFYDDGKRAYCIRGEGLPAHPDMQAQYPNGWNLLSYIKPMRARRLIVERPRIQTKNGD